MKKTYIRIIAVVLVIFAGIMGMKMMGKQGTDKKVTTTQVTTTATEATTQKVTKATTEVTTAKEEASTTEATTQKVTKATTEATTEKKNTAQIKVDDEKFDTEATTEEERDSEKADELFRISLSFIEEYDYDSDHFTMEKALMVQDMSHDYLYFVCKHDGKTEYACYNYDGSYFRDDVSQATLKKEYEDILVTKEYGEENYDVYYPFSKAEINAVNRKY